MNEQEIARIKSNLDSFMAMQIETKQAKLDILKTQGIKLIPFADQVETQIKTTEDQLAVLRQLKAQAQATSKVEELKVIHDKLAEMVGIV